MSSVRLSVIRYVPDPVRDEPRNVGVVAWRSGEVAARFMGEDEAGDLDRRHVSRRLIPDRQAYVDWVAFWRTQLAEQSISDPVQRRQVPVGDAAFLEALANVTRGGFQVRDGGEAAGAKDWTLHRLVNEAFERLVASAEWGDESEDEPAGRARHRQLAWNACRALMRHHYQERRDFVRDFRITGRTEKGHDVPAIFDIAIPTPVDLITDGRLLVVDAVSFAAAPENLNDVVDRARAVATKAQETRKRDRDVLVRALVSNGTSGDGDAGRYATQILRDDGDLELITIEEFVELVPRVKQGQVR